MTGGTSYERPGVSHAAGTRARAYAIALAVLGCDLMRGARPVRAPRGTEMTCRSWGAEAALRMLHNNLDPEVAERPDDLVVYGGNGRAARSWEAFDAIVGSLREMAPDDTLLVQSGKPVGVVRTHEGAPRVLIANSLLVPRWATPEHFRELEDQGLMMYGQMTAGSWIYIGTQGILQGTYATFAEVANQHFGGTLAGTITLTGGLGGMGGAQPLAVTGNGGARPVHRGRPVARAAPARARLPRRDRRLARRRHRPGRGRQARPPGRSRSRSSPTAPTCCPSWCAAAGCRTS